MGKRKPTDDNAASASNGRGEEESSDEVGEHQNLANTN